MLGEATKHTEAGSKHNRKAEFYEKILSEKNDIFLLVFLFIHIILKLL